MSTSVPANLGTLPEFLRVSVEKGLIDESTARRIELYRKTRNQGTPEVDFEFILAKPDEDMSFANFIEYKGNAFAVDLARNAAVPPKQKAPYSLIYIFSDTGNGKTHLLSAIANATEDRNVFLAGIMDLAADFESARKTSSTAALRQWLSSMDILLIDDLQLAANDKQLQTDLFEIFNHMTAAGRSVVVSADSHPTNLNGLESRFAELLNKGVIAGLQMPNELEKLLILKHLTKDQPFPEDVLEFIACSVTESIGKLKAVMARIAALTASDGEITLEAARAALHATGVSLGAPTLFSPSSSEEDAGTLDSVNRFKRMLASAETEQEQILALQIALGERIRQLRNAGSDATTLRRLEDALDLLRSGNMEEALKCFNS